jgi:predicted  nucleic acid-binding Zn-ribbon protein
MVEQFSKENEIAQQKCSSAQKAEADKMIEIAQLRDEMARIEEAYGNYANDMSERNEKTSEQITELRRANEELDLKLRYSDEQLVALTSRFERFTNALFL